MDIDVSTSVVTEITFSTMANIIRNSKKVNFFIGKSFVVTYTMNVLGYWISS